MGDGDSSFHGQCPLLASPTQQWVLGNQTPGQPLALRDPRTSGESTAFYLEGHRAGTGPRQGWTLAGHSQAVGSRRQRVSPAGPKPSGWPSASWLSGALEW